MNGVVFGERAAFFPAHDTLVVADLHVGRDEASAVSFPLGEREDLVARLGAACSRFDPETVVVAGDVVHTFSDVSERSRQTLTALGEVCEASGTALELVAGNHDTALANAWGEPIREAVILGASGVATGRLTDGEDEEVDTEEDGPRTVVCHGHEPPSIDADRYVVGHVHPTIEIEGTRRPCFLHGEQTYRESDLLVLPAFTRLAPGVSVSDIGTDACNSPLVTDADRLAPIVFDVESEESLRFPPLGAFRRFL